MSIPNFQIHREKISANSKAACGNTGDDPKASACWRQLHIAGQPIHWSERFQEGINYEQEKDYPVCKPYGSTAALSVRNDQQHENGKEAQG
jgi:hypothetical protein